MTRLRTALLLVFATVTVAPSVGYGAVFNVASGDVAGLIAAIDAANGNGEADTINLAAGTYTLTSVEPGGFNGLPTITSEIDIIGAGAATTTIERDTGAPLFGLMAVDASGALHIEGVTLANGSAATGGISSGGRLTVVDCVLSGNDGSQGSAIGGFGASLFVRGSVLTGNTGTTFNIFDSGAIRNVGPGLVHIEDTAIDGNTAGGVVILAFNTNGPILVTIARSAITNNPSDFGGGIFLEGSLPNQLRAFITDSTISGNSATSFGGGMWIDDADVVIRRSTISGNVSNGDGGGIFVRGGPAPDGTADVTLESSTISGNSARRSGGGIFVDNGLRGGRKVRSRGSTITANTADSDTNGSGDGGGIASLANVVEMADSILAGNADSGGEADDCSGPLRSKGHNLLQDTGGCTPTLAATDLTGVSAMLGGLAPNGGPTETHLPLV